MLAACESPRVRDREGGVPREPCNTSSECTDRLWCTGQELCAPLDPDADEFGCLQRAAPCGTSAVCDELAQACESSCDRDRDRDRDGYRAIACGGDDCDDDDPSRNPGKLEICNLDRTAIDEDCNPRTLGDLDGDEDGYVSSICCNGARCGSDCHDAEPSVHPGAAEICDSSDQDCDLRVDEGAKLNGFVDVDRDGYGRTDSPASGCPFEGIALVDGDCNDDDPNVNPAVIEQCDGFGVDDDCNGSASDPPDRCACATGTMRSCPRGGACAGGTQTCVGVAWARCTIVPAAERCDSTGLDEDCDDVVDENCACVDGTRPRACGPAQGTCVRGRQRCDFGAWTRCEGTIWPLPETCDETDEDCDGTVDEDCGP